MKLWLFLLLIPMTLNCFAQEKTIDGIVFDKNSSERIAKVSVVNTNTSKSVYNSLKGEFKIEATAGDVLVFSRPDYHADTLKVQSLKSIVVYMMPLAIQLREVTVHDNMQSPEKRLAATRQEYSKAYGSAAYNDMLSVGPGGAGLSIDALWNAFSRSGRNAKHLQETIQRDYQQNVIDYRFNKSYVEYITRLKDPQLTDFMFKYRPGYYIVVNYSDYEFIMYIRNSLRRYKRSPNNFALPRLPLITDPNTSASFQKGVVRP